MREIKFRGKMVNFERGWLTGYFFKHGEKTYIAQTGTSESGKVMVGWEEVDPETIGQYTGLKDKNGVEIYDGDIIKGNYVDNIRVIFFDDYDSSFSLYDFKSNRNVRLFRSLCDEYEVIGNKYDNPELLEERK